MDPTATDLCRNDADPQVADTAGPWHADRLLSEVPDGFGIGDALGGAGDQDAPADAPPLVDLIGLEGDLSTGFGRCGGPGVRAVHDRRSTESPDVAATGPVARRPTPLPEG